MKPILRHRDMLSNETSAKSIYTPKAPQNTFSTIISMAYHSVSSPIMHLFVNNAPPRSRGPFPPQMRSICKPSRR